jgi:hypothetical protein
MGVLLVYPWLAGPLVAGGDFLQFDKYLTPLGVITALFEGVRHLGVSVLAGSTVAVAALCGLVVICLGKKADACQGTTLGHSSRLPCVSHLSWSSPNKRRSSFAKLVPRPNEPSSGRAGLQRPLEWRLSSSSPKADSLRDDHFAARNPKPWVPPDYASVVSAGSNSRDSELMQ